jgi:hypothetical protein
VLRPSSYIVPANSSHGEWFWQSCDQHNIRSAY